jgi:hypothetical protein
VGSRLREIISFRGWKPLPQGFFYGNLDFLDKRLQDFRKRIENLWNYSSQKGLSGYWEKDDIAGAGNSWFKEDNSPVESHSWWICSAKFNWASMAENDPFSLTAVAKAMAVKKLRRTGTSWDRQKGRRSKAKVQGQRLKVHGIRHRAKPSSATIIAIRNSKSF